MYALLYKTVSLISIVIVCTLLEPANSKTYEHWKYTYLHIYICMYIQEGDKLKEKHQHECLNAILLNTPAAGLTFGDREGQKTTNILQDNRVKTTSPDHLTVGASGFSFNLSLRLNIIEHFTKCFPYKWPSVFISTSEVWLWQCLFKLNT